MCQVVQHTKCQIYSEPDCHTLSETECLTLSGTECHTLSETECHTPSETECHTPNKTETHFETENVVQQLVSIKQCRRCDRAAFLVLLHDCSSRKHVGISKCILYRWNVYLSTTARYFNVHCIVGAAFR